MPWYRLFWPCNVPATNPTPIFSLTSPNTPPSTSPITTVLLASPPPSRTASKDAASSLRAILLHSQEAQPQHASPSSASPCNPRRTRSTLLGPRIQKLESQTALLHKQGNGLERLVSDTTAQLKEFGDLQTWAEVVWRDIFVLEEVIGALDADDEEAVAEAVMEAYVRGGEGRP